MIRLAREGNKESVPNKVTPSLSEVLSVPKSVVGVAAAGCVCEKDREQS